MIEREGGFLSHPADKGRPTCFGITEAVARAHGYAGSMRQLRREEAARIYKRLYWLRPGFDQVASRSVAVAAELFDTGVNMGPAVAVTFLNGPSAARAAADSGGRVSASVLGLSTPAGSAPAAARKARLPVADAVTATEQAIQLDELIKWVKAQAEVDPDVNSSSP